MPTKLTKKRGALWYRHRSSIPVSIPQQVFLSNTISMWKSQDSTMFVQQYMLFVTQMRLLAKDGVSCSTDPEDLLLT